MRKFLRLPAALLILSAITASAQTTKLKAFGRQVEVVQPRTEIGRLSVDGRKLHENWILWLDEVALVGGVPVMIGTSGPGGNACEATPFILSFPEGRAARFDGPVDTCGVVEYKVEAAQITFTMAASPLGDGERWTWTPADGLRNSGKVAFAPDTGKGWADLRDRGLLHPADLFANGATAARLNELVGDQRRALLSTMTGPGSGRYEGDWYIGESCQAHNCPNADTGSGAMLIVDIAGRRVFVAWRLPGKRSR